MAEPRLGVHDGGETFPQTERLAEKSELIIELAAVCVRLINTSTGYALIELRQLQIGNDAAFGKARTHAVPIAEEILATGEAFVTP